MYRFLGQRSMSDEILTWLYDLVTLTSSLFCKWTGADQSEIITMGFWDIIAWVFSDSGHEQWSEKDTNFRSKGQKVLDEKKDFVIVWSVTQLLFIL